MTTTSAPVRLQLLGALLFALACAAALTALLLRPARFTPIPDGPKEATTKAR